MAFATGDNLVLTKPLKTGVTSRDAKDRIIHQISNSSSNNVGIKLP